MKIAIFFKKIPFFPSPAPKNQNLKTVKKNPTRIRHSIRKHNKSGYRTIDGDCRLPQSISDRQTDTHCQFVAQLKLRIQLKEYE